MKKTVYYAILFLAFLFASCEEDIQLDLSGNKKLVLLSTFRPDSLFTLSLSTSRPLGLPDSIATYYPPDAQIQLFKDGQYHSDFNFKSFRPYGPNPYYFSEHRPLVGSVYKVKAKYKNYPEISAQSITPLPPLFSELSLLELQEFREPSDPAIRNYLARVNLTLETTASTIQYFHLEVRQEIITYFLVGTDTIKVPFEIPLFPSLPEVDDLELIFSPGNLFRSDQLPSGQNNIEVNLDFSLDRTIELKGPIYFELKQVTKDYYLFQKSIAEQDISNFQQSIFSSEPVLIHHNIQNGLGHFSGYNLSTKTLIW